jgi:hypothetical protein
MALQYKMVLTLQLASPQLPQTSQLHSQALCPTAVVLATANRLPQVLLQQQLQLAVASPLGSTTAASKAQTASPAASTSHMRAHCSAIKATVWLRNFLQCALVQTLLVRHTAIR